jgi:predicted secreted hydrolase
MKKKNSKLPIILISSLVLILVFVSSKFFSNTPFNERHFKLQKPSELLKHEEIDTKFAKALDPYDFSFPQDHGSHEEFKTEWWYYTGNLEDANGHEFGYQLTVFRNGLEPIFDAEDKKNVLNNWQTKEIYMAHFAITDINNKKFYSFEKLGRESLGQAGARANPYKIWVKNWSIQSSPKATAENIFPIILRAQDKNISMKLNLKPVKPVTLQGLDGLSQKSSGAGNASYYYSISKLASKGKIQIGDQVFKVKGFSWLDREFSTSSLGDTLAGWDWFALQLENNVEIMYYRLRDQENNTDIVHSGGVIIDAAGEKHPFTAQDIILNSTEKFKSKYSGAEYPISWTMEIPKLDLKVKIKPLLKDQEHQNNYPYYEGAIEVNGEFSKNKITGKGYMELVGY